MRARLITTFEGKFLSLIDLKRGLQNEKMLQEFTYLLKVGAEQGRPATEILQRVVGHYLGVMSGEMLSLEETEALVRKNQKQAEGTKDEKP